MFLAWALVVGARAAPAEDVTITLHTTPGGFLAPSDPSQVRPLGQLDGAIYSPLPAVALQRQFATYNALAAHLRETMVPPDASPDGQTDRHIPSTVLDSQIECWAPRGRIAGYGFGGSIASDANANGASYGGGGVQGAFGYQVAEPLQIGFLYDFGDFVLTNEFRDKLTTQAHSFGGYLTWHGDCDYLTLIGGGGFANYDATRPIDVLHTAHSASQGGQAALYGEYGRNIHWGCSTLRPYVGALYMNVQQNAFAESGAGIFDLILDRASVNSFQTLFGAQLDLQQPSVPNVVWTVRGAWLHECINEATTGTRTASLAGIPLTGFLLAQPATGSDWAVIGWGVRGSWCANHLRPFANCDLVLGSRQSLYLGMAGIEYAW